VDWRNLPVDYTTMGYHDDVVPLLDEVRAALRRHARPIAGRPTGPAAEVLTPPTEALFAECLANLDRFGQVWKELGMRPEPVTPDELNRAVRAAAMSFWVASNLIEIKIVLDEGRLPRYSWAGQISGRRPRSLGEHR